MKRKSSSPQLRATMRSRRCRDALTPASSEISMFMTIVSPVADIFSYLLSFITSFDDILALVSSSKALMQDFTRLSFNTSWNDVFMNCKCSLQQSIRYGIDAKCVASLLDTISHTKLRAWALREKMETTIAPTQSITMIRVIVQTELVKLASRHDIMPLMSYMNPIIWDWWRSKNDGTDKDVLFATLDRMNSVYDSLCIPQCHLPISSIFTLDDKKRAIPLLQLKNFAYTPQSPILTSLSDICNVYCIPSTKEGEIRQGSCWDKGGEYYLRYVDNNNIPVFVLRSNDPKSGKKTFVDTTKLSLTTLHNLYLASLHVQKRYLK